MDLPVLWGGMHPTLMSQECVETADMVLQGEAEYALLEFMNGLKFGSGGILLQMYGLNMIRRPFRKMPVVHSFKIWTP